MIGTFSFFLDHVKFMLRAGVSFQLSCDGDWSYVFTFSSHDDYLTFVEFMTKYIGITPGDVVQDGCKRTAVDQYSQVDVSWLL